MKVMEDYGMRAMNDEFLVQAGDDVFGADGEKVGKVVELQGDYLVVEKGFFFPTDYYIPRAAVSGYDDGRVHLNVSKDEALNQGWDQPIADASGTYSTQADAGYGATDSAATIGVGDVGVVDTARTQVSGQDRISVPVHEEELYATKREREAGQVEITKDVLSEEVTLSVPVTEERVHIERHAVDRDAQVSADAFQNTVIDVPVMTEDVELQKRVRVAEEVEISKEAVQRTEQVAGTVRREVVDVKDQTLDATTTRTTGTTSSSGAVGDIVTDAADSIRKKSR